jgi:peptidoglycan/LPS O-acetylase OafA/YrhL
MEYLPKLDGIRTIAVFLVLFSHYYDFGKYGNLGYFGVNLFFFLSGYLITSLMIRDKIKIISGELTTGKALKIFFIRRSLRIFPLYYFVILLLFVLGDQKTGTNVRQDIGYYGFYLVNLKYYIEKSWDGIASHFWSLSVEEQYYLFCPFLFFICPNKWLKYGVLMVGLLSISIKIILMLENYSMFNHILLFTCVYKFCLGSMLTMNPSWISNRLLMRQSIHFVILFFVLAYIFSLVYESRWDWIIQECTCFGIFVYLLFHVRYVNNGFWHHFFSNPLVRHLGKISYGIYVYHLIVPWVVLNILSRGGMLSFIENNHLFYPICILVTIVVSHFSYFYFEKYFLNLKSRFNYAK